MAETELLPCIRCGGEMALHENDWADPPLWSAYCLAFETCGIHMPERLTRAEAIEVANFLKSPLPSPVGRREVLEEAAKVADEYGLKASSFSVDRQRGMEVAASAIATSIRSANQRRSVVTAPAPDDQGKLMPCRFCDSTSVLLYCLADGGVTVLCDDCHATGPRADDDAEAIAAWNRRPSEGTDPSWQPIDSAPKDGKAFLAWVPENKCTYAICDHPTLGRVIFGGGHREHIERATRWRPLPAPPEDS